nr:MAG TPA: hypothetical protein [Bacteriophage sp.]
MILLFIFKITWYWFSINISTISFFSSFNYR